jgi:antitoxin (DNA-binding transcriptional repressor) of toxin-antitoxin stability system
MVRVGIREFKAHMVVYIARVKAGETIVLTDRGQDALQMSPPPKGHMSSIELARTMVAEGRATWSGKKLTPPALVHVEGVSLSDLIIQEREEEAARFDPSGDEHLSR